MQGFTRRLKFKIYRTIIRLTVMHGVECWPITEEDGMRISVMGTKIMRCYLGIRRLNPTQMRQYAKLWEMKHSKTSCAINFWLSISRAGRIPNSNLYSAWKAECFVAHKKKLIIKYKSKQRKKTVYTSKRRKNEDENYRQTKTITN